MATTIAQEVAAMGATLEAVRSDIAEIKRNMASSSDVTRHELAINDHALRIGKLETSQAASGSKTGIVFHLFDKLIWIVGGAAVSMWMHTLIGK